METYFCFFWPPEGGIRLHSLKKYFHMLSTCYTNNCPVNNALGHENISVYAYSYSVQYA